MAAGAWGGVTPDENGYTLNYVYSGQRAQNAQGDLVQSVRTTPSNIFVGSPEYYPRSSNDPNLMGDLFWFYDSSVTHKTIHVSDTDGVFNAFGDSTQSMTTAFETTTNAQSPNQYISAGTNILVKGQLTLTLVRNDYPNYTPIPGAPTITAYIISTDGGNNFALATDYDLKRVVSDYASQYGSEWNFMVTGTEPPADVPVCFGSDTMIKTNHGLVSAGDLQVGNMVFTQDAGFQPIRWIGKRRMVFLPFDSDSLRPIRIKAGALGINTPVQDLLVSPQHRILVRSKIAQNMFGTDEVLIAAKQLCQIEGIDIARDINEIVYVHFLFDDHQVVISNGAETESMFIGPEALKSVGASAHKEIFSLFPELNSLDYVPVSARILATGRMGRKLAVRHAQNAKLLVS